jgi:hypothetical protein
MVWTRFSTPSKTAENIPTPIPVLVLVLVLVLGVSAFDQPMPRTERWELRAGRLVSPRWGLGAINTLYSMG